MATIEADLTAFARIRNAALGLFAADGVTATSIRDVAKRAGVSPGLVQYHFPNKAALQEAVNDYVVAVASSHFAGMPSAGSPAAVQQEVGNRVTSFARDHSTLLRYVGRAAVDGDEAALQTFDALFAIAHEQWRRAAEAGLLRPNADLTWAALDGVLIPLATVLLQGAVERHLPEDFLEPRQLARWNEANNALFREGMYHSDQPPGEGAR